MNRARGVLYFDRTSDSADKVFAAGFEHVDLTGVQGPAWPILPSDCGPDDPRVGHVVAVANLADDDPALLGASNHLLARATWS